MNLMDAGRMKEVSISETGYAREINVKDMDRPYDNMELPQERKLSPEQKAEVREETGWSNEIVDSIGSMEEFRIYQDAGVIEAQIGEKKCLIRPDIDMSQKDGFGRTNKERMEQGLAPLTPEGRPYELHHIGQHQDSPLAELTMQEHRGKGNDTILHIKTKVSEIDREEFGFERAQHWQDRADEVNEHE